MVAALALMESPAIIVGIILVNLFTPNQESGIFLARSVTRSVPE